MKLNEKIKDINEADDLLHKPDTTVKWRESYYFGWADLTNNISGFSTIGLVPNEKRRELVFLLFYDNKREVYYREPALLNLVDDINLMLKDKRLTYRLIKPFQKWEVIYKCHKFTVNIIFDSRFSTYYFGEAASWYQHFETSTIIKGEIIFKDGRIKKIQGYGQRDKSWGFRDWHQFDRWHHANFQFKDWSCAFRKDYIKDTIDLSGYIATKEGAIPVSNVEVEIIEDADKYNTPLITNYTITDKKDHIFNITAKPIDNNTSFRFARDIEGGYTEMFDQMVTMENKDTGEIGSGISELLRTKFFA